MKIKQISKLFVWGGLLLIAAALLLTGYNIREQMRAEQAAASALAGLEAEMEESRETDKDVSNEEVNIPEYLRNPEMEMPEREIDGQQYVGIVSIPSLEVQLPVISQWSYPHLKIAPCRFQGSAYLDDFIILAHNYTRHFGKLINLQLGDDVYFEDMNGNVFHYQVVEMETLGKKDMEDMLAGDWDLTLFTCTLGGKSRVTVRCERVRS